jgi:predicted phage-related endonuclease
MPDPQRKTISSTQVAALYNASPYMTPYMLYHYIRGDLVDQVQTDRMYWGLKMQPLVLERAAADLTLEVTPNAGDRYIHDDVLGYTADAKIWHPDKGHGTLESKCVYDYSTWMRDWDGGKRVPRHYELQMQTQLTVGDGAEPFRWGMFAVWCCGEMHYMERELNPMVAKDLHDQAVTMLARVRNGDEPDPFGSAIELPLLDKLLPIAKGKTLDLRDDTEARKYAELGKMLQQFRKDANFYQKAAEDARNKLRVLARDNETVLLPYGVTIKLAARSMKEHVRKASSWTAIDVKISYTEDGTDTEDLPLGTAAV